MVPFTYCTISMQFWFDSLQPRCQAAVGSCVLPKHAPWIESLNSAADQFAVALLSTIFQGWDPLRRKRSCGRQSGGMSGPQDWASGDVGVNSSSATAQLCDLGQVPSPSCASVSPSLELMKLS